MSAKGNVVLRKASSSTQWTFVVLLVLLCQRYGTAEECDFIECIRNVRSFISELRKDNAFQCRKFLNISGCSDYCMHKYYPSILSQSSTNKNHIEQYCVESIAKSSDVSWSCIARHTFQLLTCLANISSMTSNNVHGDAVVMESCRKSLEFLDCPSKVLLPDCGEESVQVVKDMIQFSVDYFIPSSCKDASIKKVLSMPVHYYLGHEFIELAKCFDMSLVGIGACFQQVIQNEIDLKEFVCREDYFSSCVNFEVSKVCGEVPSVRKLLLKLFSFSGISCHESKFVFRHLTSHKHEDPVATESSPDVHAHSPLNDEIHNLFHSLETSTSLVIEDNHHKTSHPPVYTRKYKTDLTYRPSEKPSHKDRDYFKASSGPHLLCDKNVYIVILLIILI